MTFFPRKIYHSPSIIYLTFPPRWILTPQIMLIDALFIDCRIYARFVIKSTSVPKLGVGRGGRANFGKALILIFSNMAPSDFLVSTLRSWKLICQSTHGWAGQKSRISTKTILNFDQAVYKKCTQTTGQKARQAFRPVRHFLRTPSYPLTRNSDLGEILPRL